MGMGDVNGADVESTTKYEQADPSPQPFSRRRKIPLTPVLSPRRGRDHLQHWELFHSFSPFRKASGRGEDSSRQSNKRLAIRKNWGEAIRLWKVNQANDLEPSNDESTYEA